MYEEGVPHLNYVETTWIHDYDDYCNALISIACDCTSTIYISDYVLRKAEDTEKFYDDRRISMFVGEKAKKFPKLGKTLHARAIEREGGKKSIIPDKVIIEEYKTNRTVDFDYDMDEITSVRLNDKLMARAYKGDTREVFALNAGEKEWYYVSDLRGNYAFDVEKMSDNLKAIAPDGKVNVKIEIY